MHNITKLGLFFPLFCIGIETFVYPVTFYQVEDGSVFSERSYSKTIALIDQDEQFKKEYYEAVAQACEIQHPTEKDLYAFHVLRWQGMLKILKNAAHALLKRYQNSHLFFIGQSLAYLCEACRVLDSKENNKYTQVAFSGGHLRVKKTKKNGANNLRRYAQDHDISEKSKAYYTCYLKLIGLVPTDIITRYKERGEQTIILDFIETGEGLASFLDVLFLIADKNDKAMLAKAIDIHLIRADSDQEEFIEALTLPGAGTLVNIASATYLPGNLIQSLIASDAFSDRLVPHFSSDSWESRNPFAFKISRSAASILFLVHAYLKQEGNIPNDFWVDVD